MKKMIAAFLLLTLLLTVGAMADTGYTELTPRQALRRMETERNCMIVDVQSARNYADEHIPGAINLPLDTLESACVRSLPDLDQVIFVYGFTSRASREAAELLADLGYTQVVEFGGLILWPGDTTGTDAWGADYDDDPFEAREYPDPDDFYYDYYDEFEDYEEAEDYYYEHGGW